ncbi:H(+)/Cl(-) exchange transporter 7 [Nilaparvata lugens]|uniref:H(+)/Cl(-) exchange transporter 7 n=1 Tax=Nilaparvata lugens TaxID=108931 RepID=UPI00193D0475|nr:H(+)/Cl(-) exchange transporter 7 [Nilaparvata lugens]
MTENQMEASTTAFRASSADQTLRNFHTRLTVGQEFISSKFDSLDYDVLENSVYLHRSRKTNYKMYSLNVVRRYFNFALLGAITGIIGAGSNLSIHFIGHDKNGFLAKLGNSCDLEFECLSYLFLWWMGLILFIVFIGVFLVTYIEPGAAGGGVSGVVAYLNGANIPRILNAQVIIHKVASMICTCVSGITGGKEGPMIHIGAVVGANLVLVPRKLTDSCCKIFHFDHEIRDMVAGGVAAGVAAAFAAPMGGLFLAIEESVSFLSVSLMIKIFIAAMSSSWCANLIMSLHTKDPGNAGSEDILYMGLITQDELRYTWYEIPIFILIGAIAGLFGAAWVMIQKFATVKRRKYIGANKHKKMLDGLFAAILTGVSHFALSVSWEECRQFTSVFGEGDTALSHGCPDGYQKDLTFFTLNTGEASLRWLIHEDPDSISTLAVGVLLVLYFSLAMYTTGISMAIGIFVPNLLLGALWGRFIVSLLYVHYPDFANLVEAKKYIYMASAAQLCGTLRLTFSTVVIMMEVVGNNSMVLPLMITIMAARIVGDLLSPPQFELQLILSGFPFLPPDAPPFSSETKIETIMTKSVSTLSPQISVRVANETLSEYSHGGFPIVNKKVKKNV